jgi:ABC-type uncharacterized transport system involved in gliding motility auxiliary subunit
MSAAILLVLAIAVIVTLLSERHYFRWDVTASGEHTLSEKTLQVLETIKEPVHIRAFSREGHQDARELERLLGAYRYEVPQITFEFIDPDRNPNLTRKYNVRSLNTMVLEGYGRNQTIKIADEEHITNGLIRLSKSETHKCYWVTGHGERLFKGREATSLSALQESLGEENYVFEDLYLMKSEVPGDASIVIVAAPEKPLFPEEVESLRKYLNKGGRIILFLEPFQEAGLASFIAEYGVIIENDVVIDKMSRVMGGDFLLPMVAQYGAHEITKDFRLTSFFELARTVEAAESAGTGIKATVLALTSPESWAETNKEELDQGQVGFDEAEDRKGPLSLAVISELTPPIAEENEEGEENTGNPGTRITGKGRLVVFGDADFASNKYFNTSGNADFITNTINYLVGRGDLITIKKKHRDIESLMLNREQGMVIFWVPVVFIPLLILIIGIIVYVRRRSR